MKSAVDKIFFGIILGSVTLSIGVVPLFNDFIGILLIMSGINELRTVKDENGCFMKASKACALLSIFILAGYVMNIAQDRFIILKSTIMPSIGVGLVIFIYYYLIRGLKEKAEGCKDIVESYNSWWKAVFTILIIMLIYLPFSMNIGSTQIGKIIGIMIAFMIAVIKICFAIGLRKNENNIQMKESGNEE